MDSWLCGGRAYLSAGMMGMLAAGALPPLNLVPLLFVAIPGLLLLIGSAPNARSAALRGLIFGFVHHLAGLYWITNAILVMAAEFWWAVPIAVPLLAFVLAIFIAVPCGLAWFAPAGWRRLFAFAGLYVAGDLARQFVLSGFPWNLLATVWEMPGSFGLVFMQPAALVGAHGLTFFTLLVTGALAAHRRGHIVSLAALAVWAGIGGMLLARTAPPTGLTTLIVQGNIPETEHRDHWRDAAWAAGVFEKYLTLTRQGMAGPGPKPNLVIWPETASPYDLSNDSAARQAIAAAAGPTATTLAGTVSFSSATIAHNSLAAVAPDGRLAGLYNKAHLVPYGEYFPAYAHILLGEQGFTPGPGRVTLHLPGLPPIGPLICYEAIFPAQVVRESDRPSVLVNITNDSWFGNSSGPRQHLAAARLRTIEEGLPMLRAANTGISAVIDAHGRFMASLPLNKAGILKTAIPGALPRPLAAVMGLTGPALLALMSCCAAWFLPPRRARRVG